MHTCDKYSRQERFVHANLAEHNMLHVQGFVHELSPKRVTGRAWVQQVQEHVSFHNCATHRARYIPITNIHKERYIHTTLAGKRHVTLRGCCHELWPYTMTGLAVDQQSRTCFPLPL